MCCRKAAQPRYFYGNIAPLEQKQHLSHIQIGIDFRSYYVEKFVDRMPTVAEKINAFALQRAVQNQSLFL